MQFLVNDTPSERIDIFVTRQVPELTRSRVQSLIKSGDILLNNKPTKPKQTVSNGDTIDVKFPTQNLSPLSHRTSPSM